MALKKPDATKILVGAPDQTVSGAILRAPLGTALPTTVFETLDEAFEAGGFISDDGVEVATSSSSTEIKDWSGQTVRVLKTEYSVDIKYSHLETSTEALYDWAGKNNVVVEKASDAHGNQVTVKLRGDNSAPEALVIRCKDGDNKMLLVAPNTQLKEVGGLKLSGKEPIKWEITRTCAPDEDGVALYLITDDGKKAA